MATTKIEIATTKRGIPAAWESGGGMTNTGHSRIVSGRDGEKRRPVYVRTGGHLACGEHALIPVHEGFHIVDVGRHGSNFTVTIYKIVSVSVKDIDGEKWEASAEAERVAHFTDGEWDSPLERKFEAAVAAAREKASIYHCRGAVYIDTSPKPEASPADKARRDAEVKRQDAERAHLRDEKAARLAREKAEAEAASKAAKAAGLGQRLEAANVRLGALGVELAKLEEVSFTFGWQSFLFSEANVRHVEAHVEQLEAQAAERARKLAIGPQFEVFLPRAEALGLTIEFADDCVRFAGTWDGHFYTANGLASFEAQLVAKEKAAAEAKAKAELEARYQARREAAAALGLPQNVSIWKRTGGRTNAGCGWVIGADGVERPPTSMYNANPRRLERYGEGYMAWEQILPGEVVLKWSKDCTAAAHVFEVVHLPAEGLTPAQLTHIAMLEEDLEREWEGLTGLASGRLSPSVGKGWGLKAPPPVESNEPSGPADPAALLSALSRLGRVEAGRPKK